MPILLNMKQLETQSFPKVMTFIFTAAFCILTGCYNSAGVTNEAISENDQSAEKKIRELSVGVITRTGGSIDEILQDEKYSAFIRNMRKADYPGSVITEEQRLGDKNNYKQYIVSYYSEGYKIFALLRLSYIL